MATPTNVIELFAPLGKRLSEYYESKNYVQQAKTEYHINIEGGVHYSGKDFMKEIIKDANLFDENEVYLQAKTYYNRVNDILKSLESTLNERSVYYNMDLEDVVSSVNAKRGEELLGRHKEELQTYLNSLEVIIKPREGTELKKSSIKKEVKNEAATTTSAEMVINLPESFTVKQLNKHFTPQLSVNQAALFLYYLKEQAVLPPYSDSSIGKLAEAFFVRNQKNVTKGLSDIYTIKSNEGELSNLKKVLQKLIKEIDNDLKDAR